MREDVPTLRSRSNVPAVVRGFERCELTKQEWNHAAHLTVAAWYVLHHPEPAATNKMIGGILRFNRARRIRQTPTSGYHETLTLFWLAIARRFLRGLPEEMTPYEKIDRFVDAFASRRDLVLDYYSVARIWSWEARVAWVEPDRRPLMPTAATSVRDRGSSDEGPRPTRRTRFSKLALSAARFLRTSRPRAIRPESNERP